MRALDQTAASPIDLSGFPVIVSHSARLAEPGMALAWLDAMDEALATEKPFVLINLGASGSGNPEDKKAAALWFKERRNALKRLCRGMVMVEPDREQWAKLRPTLDQQERAFGMVMPIVANLDEGRAAAQILLGGDAP